MSVSSRRLGLIPWVVGVAVAGAAAWFFFDKPLAFSETGAAAGAPVLLELFTSEGCSSCPPADALLTEIGASNQGVIPLAYHVDYWNHLGWSDPFSSSEFSARQSAYARAMSLGGEYTPQTVIDGTSQCIGSDRASIWRAIAAARAESAGGHVNLRIRLDKEARKLEVSLSAEFASAPGTGRAEVMVAIFENGLVSKIGAGENGGRTITYDYTVRKLLPAFELDSNQSGSAEGKLSLDLDPGWSLNHLGVAAFIQDLRSLRILGAASRYPIWNE
jgi:hypothetical protein